MYFLLAMICALLGMGIILYRSPIRSTGNRYLIDTDRWIEHFSMSLRSWIRNFLKFIVVHLVYWYRHITRDISIHTTVKQKVRELLYEHHTSKGILKKKSNLSHLTQESLKK